MNDPIVDYVEIVRDDNGEYRVRAKSNNGQTIWTTEQYGSREWAQQVAADTGKPLMEDDDE